MNKKTVDFNHDRMPGSVFVIGSYNTDLVYRLKDFVLPGQTIAAINNCNSHGGKGLNQAIACNNAGGATHFMTKLGDDSYADNAKKYLSSLRFHNLSIFEESNCPTGTAIVMVSETVKDNCIIVNPGANDKISSIEAESLFNCIKKSYVMLSQLEVNLNALMSCINFAKSNGVKIILNPAPWREDARSFISLVDILTPNLSEAEEIIGKTISSNDEVRDAAESIHDMGAKNVIITLGEKGCWMFDGRKHQYFPPHPASVVDTSGAGDAFNGALAARIAQRNSLQESIAYACCFSALAVEREGASNMPHHHLVKQRITLGDEIEFYIKFTEQKKFMRR